MSLWSPLDVVRWLVRRLPKTLQDLIFNISVLMAWITLPVWVISTLSELRVAVEWWQAFLDSSAPYVRAAAVYLADLIRPVLDLWRGFTRPLHAWLAANLPFPAPMVVVELMLAVLPAIPAFLRVRFAERAYRKSGRALEEESDEERAAHERIAELGRSIGPSPESKVKAGQGMMEQFPIILEPIDRFTTASWQRSVAYVLLWLVLFSVFLTCVVSLINWLTY